jgi:hypothetical protein
MAPLAIKKYFSIGPPWPENKKLLSPDGDRSYRSLQRDGCGELHRLWMSKIGFILAENCPAGQAIKHGFPVQKQ